MSLDKLKEQRNQLLLNRSALKDQLEGTEKALGQINFTIQVLEEQAKEEEDDNDES